MRHVNATYLDSVGIVHMVVVESDGFRPEYYVRCGQSAQANGVDNSCVSIHAVFLGGVRVPTCVRCLGTAL